MTTTYEYTRNSIAGGYDIETEITDEGGDVYTIQPAKGISELFPTAKFKLFGEENKFLCVFEEALTTEEEAQLDAYIASYRTGE